MTRSEEFDNVVRNNMLESEKKQKEFFDEYYHYLKQYPNLSSRYKRLCRSIPRDYRIVLKAEFLPTLSEQEQQKYFDLLEQYQMRLKDEALDCVSEIATSNNPVIEMNKWARLPWISVSLIGPNVYRVSFLGEDYTFIPIQVIYQNNIEQIKQKHIELADSDFSSRSGYDPFEPGNLDYECHFASEQFALQFPNVYALTSLCPYITNQGFWYHSFNLNQDKTIVLDVANGFIMNYESFQNLLEPIVLDQTLGKNIASRQDDLLASDDLFYLDYATFCPLKGFAFQNFDSFSSETQQRLLKKISL